MAQIDNFGDKLRTNSFKHRPKDAARTGGAKKGKRTTTIIKELLKMDVSKFSTNKDLKGLDVQSALAVQLFALAFKDTESSKDKLNAIKEILDRTEGKATQHVETKTIDNKIQVEILTDAIEEDTQRIEDNNNNKDNNNNNNNNKDNKD